MQMDKLQHCKSVRVRSVKMFKIFVRQVLSVWMREGLAEADSALWGFEFQGLGENSGS